MKRGAEGPADDIALVSRAVRGDQAAFGELVTRHNRSVFNLIARMVRDNATAEELAQDAFVKAFRALRTFDPAFKFSSWLLRIAHNTAIDHLRKLSPPMVSIGADEAGRDIGDVLVDQRERTPFERAEHADLSQALEWAIGQLRPEYRRLVVLRYREDEAYEDIASALDLPLGTVKSHLHRARAELARLMTEAGWGPVGAGESGAVQPGKGSAS